LSYQVPASDRPVDRSGRSIGSLRRDKAIDRRQHLLSGKVRCHEPDAAFAGWAVVTTTRTDAEPSAG
jgi:hypothetical protein